MTDIALRHALADQQAVAAVAHGDLGHEAEMRRHEPVRGLAVAGVPPSLRQRELLRRLQHRELANLVEVAREATFVGEHGQRTGHGILLDLMSPCRADATDNSAVHSGRS